LGELAVQIQSSCLDQNLWTRQIRPSIITYHIYLAATSVDQSSIKSYVLLRTDHLNKTIENNLV